jgi:rhodanese-related sulfurtransferase
MNTITPQQLKERMDQGEELFVVDVREPDEHAAFNIGGRLVPVGDILAMQIEDIDEWKDKEVIFYCRSGARSARAAQFAEMLGFQNTVNLTGGMLAWKEAFPS